ncbi:zf-TFIIB domain-containing protein [Patescibacteria group bacterium]|nr:zf-TFIIB domain-containing protein [Patescibacteria group bacterium]MBU4481268.1 zf-TFIIB domain-containing protein [Patescibacteria group bacterium]
MKCPKCKKELSEKIKIGDVEIDRCPNCGGLWFEKDELRLAKDKEAPEARWVDIEIKDKSLNWFQFDIWKSQVKFKVKKELRYCPIDEIPLYQVNYGDTSIEIDVCGICFGIWLDKGEFKKIIDYVENKADYEVLYNYAKNLARETKEIFVGPESVKSEATDLLVLIKLLKYKLAVQHPLLVKLISNLR